MTTVNGRYNLMELMVCVAARQLDDGRTAVIGTGMPLAAAMLAQKTTARHLVVMFEAGSAAPELVRLPVSVADSYTHTRAILHSSMDEIMETCQRGLVDYTFLGGAQIDMYGNLNTTMIGTDYQHPKERPEQADHETYTIPVSLSLGFLAQEMSADDDEGHD